MPRSEVAQCQIFRCRHLLWFLRKFLSTETHLGFFQDFPEQLLVQVNLTLLFLRLQLVTDPPNAMSGKHSEQSWPPGTQPLHGRWS